MMEVINKAIDETKEAVDSDVTKINIKITCRGEIIEVIRKLHNGKYISSSVEVNDQVKGNIKL